MSLEAIQLSAAMLRQQAPELVLRLGSTVAARVLERHGGHGLITIGNAVLSAKLPDQVRAGDSLRLLVHDANQEQVTLRVADQASAPQPLAQPVVLPNGARLWVDPEEGQDARGKRQEGSIALAYNSPALGSMRFHLSSDSRALSVLVRAAPGGPLEMAEHGAGELREALARITGKAVQVTIAPREDPVDLYA
jgi:hypothetical protein